jgi:hypothetical protein
MTAYFIGYLDFILPPQQAAVRMGPQKLVGTARPGYLTHPLKITTVSQKGVY